ncbi:CPBP family intramembrane glutamic endopeptidase [Natrarchaeobaculum aegyptiacum]|uniref:CAAX prenyl protease 2/Lysostaphin resistance protein A-like domain-containing protein n=1 Tax=Natrarchaeobaculum aegyptiacum TaxID=745377 RepID=A0A2Z2HQ74_9EURY|nr:type II CAAX endopeptidase family protein [Natrarchaeobaculum aegyptiacum]ARS89276.1 hypothetical protein B1756_05630 [Natrarchaeobaculum aegyptiacum]
MTETTGTGDDPAADPETTVGSSDAGVVQLLGLVVATLTLVTAAVPLGQGMEPGADIDALAVVATTLAALFATVAFLGRRFALLRGRTSGPLAAGSGLVTLLLSGYAINRGATGAVDLPVPGLEPIPSMAATFVLGAAVVGLGVADAASLSAHEVKRRTLRLVEAIAVGVLGLLAIAIAMNLLAVPAFALLGDLSELQLQLLSYLAFAVGLGSVAAGYLAWYDRDRSFLDLAVPTLRDAGWTIAGLIVLFVVLLAGSWVMSATGMEAADHGTILAVEENPELLWVILPAMFLVVGPFEELLYRNVVQKSLYETFSRYGAVVVTSVAFALVHAQAYATAGAGLLLASLAMVFGLSLVLGTIYERTENLLVPAIAHGAFNAVQFTMVVLW